MGCCFSKKKKKIKIKVVDNICQDEAFNYLQPKGRLILRMDSVYNIPKIYILFDDWNTNSVRLWPKTKKASEHFLNVERAPPNTFYSSESYDDISLDTVH